VTAAPRRAILSLATKNKHYPEGLLRLHESLLRVGFSGEFMCWPPGSFPAGCPPHREVPFAFKPFCFVEACQRGVDLALWMDAACVAVRSLESLFREIDRRGYLLFRNGRRRLGEWASDEALARFGIGREQAMSIPEVNAATLGLDLRSAVGREFLDRWHAAAQHGVAFRGVPEALRTREDYKAVKSNRARRASADPRVRGHRHDQTVAGILAYRLGLTLTPVGLQAYSSERRRIEPASMIVVDRDTGRSGGELSSVARVRRDRYLGRWLQLLRERRLSWRPSRPHEGSDWATPRSSPAESGAYRGGAGGDAKGMRQSGR
jgi:hypothetical protein